MVNNLLILVQKNDEKFKLWKSHNESPLKLKALNGSPLAAPFEIIKTLTKGQKLSAYVFRYLNDYKSLSKTLLRLLSEILVVVLCKVMGIKVLWICHNIDRETDQYHSFLTSLRRKLVYRSAGKVFVTDRLLIEHFQSHFQAPADKVDFISFGLVEPKTGQNYSGDSCTEQIKEFRRVSLSTGRTSLICLCAGSLKEGKYLHFDDLDKLVNAFRLIDIDLLVIAAGSFVDSDYGKRLVKKYSQNKNIVLFEKYTEFSHDFIRTHVDFYYRVYNDISVPYTVYESALLNKPLLTKEYGFLSEMVVHYNLGYITNDDFSDLNKFLSFCHSSNRDSVSKFLTEHNWSIFSEKVYRALSDELTEA